MKIVKCGVSQGAILGPLLLLIFLNDLINSTKVLDPFYFAENTNLFCSNDNIRTFFHSELNQINDWFLANRLCLNLEKTKYIFSHKLTDENNIPLKLPSL